LSNQVLILGFLRSAAKLLAPGPVPEAFAKKRKAKEDDDDEEIEEFDDDEPTPSRGTVMITLRNVVPYTEWYAVEFSLTMGLTDLGMCPSSPKIHHRPPDEIRLTQDTFHCGHSSLIEIYGKATSTG